MSYYGSPIDEEITRIVRWWRWEARIRFMVGVAVGIGIGSLIWWVTE